MAAAAGAGWVTVASVVVVEVVVVVGRAGAAGGTLASFTLESAAGFAAACAVEALGTAFFAVAKVVAGRVCAVVVVVGERPGATEKPGTSSSKRALLLPLAVPAVDWATAIGLAVLALTAVEEGGPKPSTSLLNRGFLPLDAL